MVHIVEMPMEVTQILLNAQAVDGAVRKQAENSLEQFQELNLASFLFSLAAELENDEKPAGSRKLAGLILKNALDAKEQQRKIEFVQRWLSLDPTLKAEIKACLLRTLSSPSIDARSTASQVIAKVAGIDLPRKQWLEFMGYLVSDLHQLPAPTRHATLQILEYICEEVSPDEVELNHVNKIRIAAAHLGLTEENSDVRLAAIRVCFHFSNDEKRRYLMRFVCGAIHSPELQIRREVFERLIAISSTHYEELGPYTYDIYDITKLAVMVDEEPVALKAIEFWISILDETINRLKEYGVDFSWEWDSRIPIFYNRLKGAVISLGPLLLETLLRQEEEQDLDEGAWNIAMAGGTCLGFVARIIGDKVVPDVMLFFENNINKPDWREREAATYAFGCILAGPSPDYLLPLANRVLDNMLIALMEETDNRVKETTAWTLGRMFEFLPGSALDISIITQENCQQIIFVLLQSMKDVPHVAENACDALYFLFQGDECAGSATSHLTPAFLEEICDALITAKDREDAGNSRLRTEANEALKEVKRCLERVG